MITTAKASRTQPLSVSVDMEKGAGGPPIDPGYIRVHVRVDVGSRPLLSFLSILYFHSQCGLSPTLAQYGLHQIDAFVYLRETAKEMCWLEGLVHRTLSFEVA